MREEDLNWFFDRGNPDGIYNKYRIERTDGTRIDPKDEYFVLKIKGSGDADHLRASAKAMKCYAEVISKSNPIFGEACRRKVSEHARKQTNVPFGVAFEWMRKSESHIATFSGHRIRIVSTGEANVFEDLDWHITGCSGPTGDKITTKLPLKMIAGRWNIQPVTKTVSFTEALTHMRGGKIATFKTTPYTRDAQGNLIGNAGQAVHRKFDARLTGEMIEGQWEINHYG